MGSDLENARGQGRKRALGEGEGRLGGARRKRGRKTRRRQDETVAVNLREFRQDGILRARVISFPAQAVQPGQAHHVSLRTTIARRRPI